MRYPSFLKEGETIGFIAPSFGCNIEPYHSAFKNALKKFQSLGYLADLGPNCFLGEGIGISNTPEACGKELTEFYCSPNNQVLLSCGGGELMCETISHTDFEAIKNAPAKWFMGFSDNTNFTYLLTTLCDTASIYGPCAASFGMEPWHPAIHDALSLLTGAKKEIKGYGSWEKDSLKDDENPLVPYHITEPTMIKKYPDESISITGRMIGGCMDCLVNLLGTEYDKTSEFLERYKDDGFIWFLEACDLNVMSIRRAIWQMKHAGWFQYVKGFLFGRPLCFGEDAFGLDQYQAILPLLSEYNVPILMDIDLGHLPPSMPIICGGKATVTSMQNDLSILYTEL